MGGGVPREHRVDRGSDVQVWTAEGIVYTQKTVIERLCVCFLHVWSHTRFEERRTRDPTGSSSLEFWVHSSFTGVAGTKTIPYRPVGASEPSASSDEIHMMGSEISSCILWKQSKNMGNQSETVRTF